jgi:polysaccharide biosynthesis protein PslG
VRRLLPVLTSLVAVALLAGCSADGDSAGPSASRTVTSPATASSTPLPSPSASVPPSPSPSPSPSGEAVRIPATVTGLHVAGVQDGAWPDANVPFGALRLWDNGTAWSQIETVKGAYTWALVDRAVANAEKQGITDILMVLGSTPTWNAKRIVPTDYPVPGAASAPKSLAAWDAFVTKVVKRYKGRITAYQIWNEASLVMFWDGTPEAMAELTKRAYDIIKREDPKARVVAASTTVRLAGAFDRFFPDYLAALAERDWPIDVFAAHMYPTSKGTTDDRAAYITQVADALTAAGAPDLPVWDTELNYGLAGPGPKYPRQTIEGAKARDWVVQTTFDSLALGISRTYWYIWTPVPYPLLGMQLTNGSGAVKGLRIVDQWIVGGTTTGCTDDGSVTSCPVEKNGVPSVIAWADDESGTLVAPEGMTQACTTANRCSPIDGPLQVSETPVRLLP